MQHLWSVSLRAEACSNYLIINSAAKSRRNECTPHHKLRADGGLKAFNVYCHWTIQYQYSVFIVFQSLILLDHSAYERSPTLVYNPFYASRKGLRHYYKQMTLQRQPSYSCRYGRSID